MIENYSMCLNELLRASCPPPFGPAGLFKFIPDEFVRKNLAANLDRSPLIHSYCYASAGDQSTFAYRDVGGRATQGAVAEKAIFPLIFVPFMQHAG